MQVRSVEKTFLRCVFLIAFIWTPASNALEIPAEAISPTQQQLQTLLSGNSMKGTWAGSSYIQYFSNTGSTEYQEEGVAKSIGNWWINSKGEYCSIWRPSSQEVCYPVRVHDRNIYWWSGENIYPSTVVDGNIFN